MKRVLVLNVDSFVGRHVCRQFYDAKEYLVDGTFHHHQRPVAVEEVPDKTDTVGNSLRPAPDVVNTGEAPAQKLTPPPTPEVGSRSRLFSDKGPDKRLSLEAEEGTMKLDMNDMKPYLNEVIPRHWEINDEDFRSRLLTYDIIIAILEENGFEAECAIKILRGTHYEVEKTFVLVSSVFTWAQTDMRDFEAKRAARRAAREAERIRREQERANREEYSDDEDETEEEEDTEEEEEQLELKVWTEDEYRRRYPDTRYHGWRALEHTVKQSNSETLHTYVLWAGLPYGAGEDLLQEHFFSAWRHQSITQYGEGSNYIPTIHVKDLSRIIFLVGSSYDTLEDRYMFAVDQGNNTQREILEGIRDYIGGTLEITDLVIDREGQVMSEIEQLRDLEDRSKREKEVKTVISDYEEELRRLEGERRILVKRIRKLEEVAKQRQMYKSIMSGKQRRENAEMITREQEELDRHYYTVEGIEIKILRLKEELAQKKSEASLFVEYSRLRLLRERVRESEKFGLLLSGNVEEYDKRVMVPETAMADVRLYIDEPHGLGNWFSAVNVRCESGAVLNLLGESDWVSLGGFVANVDKVVQEFKSERLLCPMRLLVAGPPCSRVTEVSTILASLFGTVSLTIEDIIASFEAHVGNVREQMVNVLQRRHVRRLEARQERIRRARQRRLQERQERLRAKRADTRGAEGSDDTDDEGEGEEEGDEEGYENEEEEDGEGGLLTELSVEGEGGVLLSGRLTSSSPQPAGEVNIISENQLLYGRDEEEDDEEEESEAESDVDTRSRQLAQQVEEKERFEIATLREEYRFCTKVLKLRLLNGELPSVPKSEDDGEEEEEEDEDEEGEQSYGNRSRSKGKPKDDPPVDTPPIIRYFDEALAVMVRWRLRQADCRNQGYVLRNFPQTVRQARLVFLADTPEQKEQQRPKLRRNLGDSAEVPKPFDFSFPLPSIDEMNEKQRKEILSAMNGKSFVSSDDALAPTNDALFPDCLVMIQASRELVEAELSKSRQRPGSSGNNDKDPYEELTHFLENFQQGAPPTESLLCWYQTVVVEKPEEGDDAPTRGEGGGEEPVGGGKPPRSLSVVFAPVFTATPHKLNGSEEIEELTTVDDSLMGYCAILREKILNNVGLSTCGEVIDSILEETKSEKSLLLTMERESGALSHLRRGFKTFLRIDGTREKVCVEEERCVLRYFEAKEVFTEVAGLEDLPSELYLMRYVLPSLTPLMAEVVRLRPEDPVAALADSLFHYKRRTRL